MTETLLALIATLTGCMVWVVRKYGEDNSSLIASLTEAVTAFREFEKSEDEIHHNIVTTQERLISTQTELAETQRQILKSVERLERNGS